MYGYQDSGDLAPGKQGGKFGLNTGAFVTKFEYNANSGKDGAAGDAIDLCAVQTLFAALRHTVCAAGRLSVCVWLATRVRASGAFACVQRGVDDATFYLECVAEHRSAAQFNHPDRPANHRHCGAARLRL